MEEKDIKNEDINKDDNINANADNNVSEHNENVSADEANAENAQPEEERDPLDVALEEIESLKNQLLYKQAEFDNYRKRTMKEKAELILGGGEKTIVAVLPVLDDFERALADKSDDPEAVREGMQLIYNKFNKILEQQGVKKIETKDTEFDVDFHEAIAMVPGLGDAMKNKVIDCVQTGYMLNEKVIRHAKVAVGQ